MPEVVTIKLHDGTIEITEEWRKLADISWAEVIGLKHVVWSLVVAQHNDGRTVVYLKEERPDGQIFAKGELSTDVEALIGKIAQDYDVPDSVLQRCVTSYRRNATD